MFASLSRGSSRVKNSYICSSCLCSIVAHPSNFISVPAAQLNVPGSLSSFSTTSISHEAENAAKTSSSANPKLGESAEPKQSVESKQPAKARKPTQSLRKQLRRNSHSGRVLSKSTAAISALRASMLAEDAVGESKQSAPRSTAAPKKKGKPQNGSGAEEKSAERAAKSEKPRSEGTPEKEVAKTTTKSSVKGKGSSKKTKVVQSQDTQENVDGEPSTEKGVDASTKDTIEVAKDGKPKTLKGVKKSELKGVKGKLKLSKKTQPLRIHKVMSRERVAKAEDPRTVAKDLNAFAAGLGVEASSSSEPLPNSRQTLVQLIQSGKLTGTQRLEAITLLRRLLIVQPAAQRPQEPAAPQEGQSIKDALLSSRTHSQSPDSPSQPSFPARPGRRQIVRSPPGPIKISKDVTKYEIETIDSDELQLVPLESDGIAVPSLSYGLDRVLFNPGVYQLQDPRSRVFNFDPYLQTIMPVHEFDFNALKQYITSSRDTTLLRKAKHNEKKYTGSTSSMTSAMAHFHFLLSQWRPITTGNLSKMFPVEYESFTALQRAPNAIFLRHKDGVYAIDADKQYDSANILMMLGKSMEKLLTLSTDEFERYRRANSDQISEEERNAEEAFHYTTMGDFLMRSQLDAYDPRLPGTGMFDLKTRAVISVRMDAEQYEEGRGYQIRSRHGEWESYEREYYDMIRAAFLKYSLQVRMGRMDGIFVAFHNTEKIFGFQYISLPEMDFALHGTDDTKIGDNEFKLSLELLNRALDRATAKFPGQSLRLHFETRDAVTPFMYIFAEPIEEERIDKIQSTNKAKIEEFERKILGLADDKLSDDDRKAEWDNLRAEVEESMEMDKQDSAAPEDSREYALEDEELDVESKSSRSAAAVEELDIEEEDIEETEDSEAKGEPDLEAMSDEELEEMENIISSAAPEDAKEQDNPEEALVEEEITTSEEDVEINEREVKTREEKGLLGETEGEVLSEESEEGQATAAKGNTEAQEIEFEDEEDSIVIEDATSETELPETGDLDAPFLPNEEQTEQTKVLGMTLTIRNKINGEYVERPRRLDNGEKWEVEYALEEIPKEKASMLYRSCLVRRKKALVREVDLKTDTKWNDRFIETIKKLSKQGKMWRAEQDLKERDMPLKTLYPVDGQVIRERKRDTFWDEEKLLKDDEVVAADAESDSSTNIESKVETTSTEPESRVESDSPSNDEEKKDDDLPRVV